MSTKFVRILGLCALAACAGQSRPTQNLAASMAAVRGAETAGAAQVPGAALHLKLAQEQISQAQEMSGEDDERSDSMAIRAYSDAELALALTREAQATQRVESLAAMHPEVSSEPSLPSDRPVFDAAKPSGAAAPSAPASGTEGITP